MTYNRRQFVQTASMAALAYTLGGCEEEPAEGPVEKPNVLFISLDDLNDWIEPLGGHPQARTPNLIRFAGEAVNLNYSLEEDADSVTVSVFDSADDWRKDRVG